VGKVRRLRLLSVQSKLFCIRMSVSIETPNAFSIRIVGALPRYQRPSLSNRVGVDNPVRFIDAFVDEPDLAAAGFVGVKASSRLKTGITKL
jgi:hypothetical protein